MKILFIGDASNLHNTLAKALRALGHTCTVVSNGSGWQQTDRDMDVTREPGFAGTARYMLRMLSILPKTRGYDIVHFINPHFFHFRPQRLALILKYLKRNNRFVFYSASCTDLQYVITCHDGKTFRYSDFLVGKEPSPYMKSDEVKLHNHWHIPEVADYHRQFVKEMDGIVACLYEYYEAYRRCDKPLAYSGIPIDIEAIKPRFIDNEPDKVRFFIGIQRNKKVLKGTEQLLFHACRLCGDYPDLCEMTVAENVPYKEYVQMMSSSHVILDQLYSYTPATNALIAMAQGLVAVSGAEPEYYDFIGEKDNHPIINVSPLENDNIYNKLEWIIRNKQELPRLSRMSREFVVKHNDSHIVAQRHIDFWNKFTQK